MKTELPHEGKKIIKVKVRVVQPEKKPLPIRTEFIKLDAALKLSGIAETGGHAKILITEEQCVFVNEEKCIQRGRKLVPGDTVRCHRDCFEVISE